MPVNVIVVLAHLANASPYFASPTEKGGALILAEESAEQIANTLNSRVSPVLFCTAAYHCLATSTTIGTTVGTMTPRRMTSGKMTITSTTQGMIWTTSLR